MNPTFKQIWNGKAWAEYKAIFKPRYTQRFFKVRSVVRMTLWIPIVSYLYYLMLVSI